MRVQRGRADVLPLTWELPTAIGLAWLVLTVGGLVVGQAVAYILAGRQAAWPVDLSRGIAGLLRGEPGVAISGSPPAGPLVFSAIGVVEMGIALAGVMAVSWWWQVAGPGAQFGLASRHEVRSVLGERALNDRRRAIRPDLDRNRCSDGLLGIGWRLGRSRVPSRVEVWVPFDRTAGIYGAQGSGKTLDLLAPALLGAPGAALVTLTKPEDLLLTIGRRRRGGRPVAVLDPFDLAPGQPSLVWDPVAGCVDPMVAERRAKAFTAGTVRGAVSRGAGDDAARFYAAEGAKVLQGYFHAAALEGHSVDRVLTWLADPRNAAEPEEILRTHPSAARFWDGLLRGALQGDDRTSGNTITTVQQSMALFFQESIRRRCTPREDSPATDLEELIKSGGTVYLLGRDDPYASASPLMTAVAEHVLDTALGLAMASPYGRLCPSFLACLDELPSTTPLPTLRTRVANERALGLSFIYAAQTWRQLVICYGEDEARALFGLTNNLVVFGGGKDVEFYQDLSALIGTTRVARRSFNKHQGGWGSSVYGEDVPVLRPEEIRELPERHALVIAENARPFVARLSRCVDGRSGRELLRDQETARAQAAVTRAESK
jgi:type IV secretion system protein VirD4